MQSFTYKIFFKFLYRYGNIPATILLSVYAVSLAVNLDKGLVFIIPFVVTFVVIYFVNRHYLMLYKILPFTIGTDDEKMVCSDFIFNREPVTIFFKDIVSLEGGIFHGRLNGVMKIKDGVNNRTIGFYDKINGARKLETLILSKVDKKIYDEIVDKLGMKKEKPAEKK